MEQIKPWRILKNKIFKLIKYSIQSRKIWNYANILIKLTNLNQAKSAKHRSKKT